MSAGYSKRSLVEKLGLKPSFVVAFFNPPSHYFELLEDLPSDLMYAQQTDQLADFVHYFAQTTKELETDFPILRAMLKPAGSLWISWPKGSSKLPTDLNENIIRDSGLTHGLVDVKVAAIDEDWSGLKFVYRLKDRMVN